MGTDDIRVASGIRVLESRYGDTGLRLDDVAKEVGLSPWHFDRILKRNTGATFRTHIFRVRMKNAEELLAVFAMAIKEIAFVVGYRHVSEFDRAFKRSRGCTPSAWRTRSLEER